MNINNYIEVKNYIPKKLCTKIVSLLTKQKNWQKHKWYDVEKETSESETEDITLYIYHVNDPPSWSTIAPRE